MPPFPAPDRADTRRGKKERWWLLVPDTSLVAHGRVPIHFFLRAGPILAVTVAACRCASLGMVEKEA